MTNESNKLKKSNNAPYYNPTPINELNKIKEAQMKSIRASLLLTSAQNKSSNIGNIEPNGENLNGITKNTGIKTEFDIVQTDPLNNIKRKFNEISVDLLLEKSKYEAPQNANMEVKKLMTKKADSVLVSIRLDWPVKNRSLTRP